MFLLVLCCLVHLTSFQVWKMGHRTSLKAQVDFESGVQDHVYRTLLTLQKGFPEVRGSKSLRLTNLDDLGFLQTSSECTFGEPCCHPMRAHSREGGGRGQMRFREKALFLCVPLVPWVIFSFALFPPNFPLSLPFSFAFFSPVFEMIFSLIDIIYC